MGEFVEALAHAFYVDLLVEAVTLFSRTGECFPTGHGGVDCVLVAGAGAVDPGLSAAEGFVEAAPSPRPGPVGVTLQLGELRRSGREPVPRVPDGFFEGCGALVGGGDGLVGDRELVLEGQGHVGLFGESASLRGGGDVGAVVGEYVVSPPKSAAGRRSVSLPRLAADALDAHLRSLEDQSSEALVFPAPEGGYLVAQNFRKRMWLPAVKAAGLAPLRLHDLRHTCASLAIASGADVKVLQRMLGHASAAITLDRYGHLLPGQAESVAERLDQMARAAGTTPLASVEPLDRSGAGSR